MSRAALAVLLVALTACHATPDAIPPKLESIATPELGVAGSAEVGDTLIEKAVAYYYEGLQLGSEATGGDGFIQLLITVPAQALPAKYRSGKWTYFEGQGCTVHDAILGTSATMGGLKRSNEDPSVLRVYGNNFTVGLTPNDELDLAPVLVPAGDRAAFRQELIYGGRRDESLKLLYREYSNDFLQAPHTQELLHDLSDGSVIGFKGARIEVLEATSTNLDYLVLESFADPEPGLPDAIPVEAAAP